MSMFVDDEKKCTDCNVPNDILKEPVLPGDRNGNDCQPKDMTDKKEKDRHARQEGPVGSSGTQYPRRDDQVRDKNRSKEPQEFDLLWMVTVVTTLSENRSCGMTVSTRIPELFRLDWLLR